MKVTNMMNFVRRIDERMENSVQRLLEFTKTQLRLVNQYGVDNTFLLQYDAVCDEDFVNLFKSEATDRTELGLWYEIVEPLTNACGLPYRSENGWKWDWHIIPGFSMGYTPSQREKLIDEAMRKFREVFGYYPKTVASWVIDTHTLNYLSQNYDVSAIGICRDQVNTDAYSLVGGYFNQAYYPSSNNIFTPAQSKEMQVNVPVFRLLGPCPIHNYDNHKYSSEEFRKECYGCFTLEPVWYMGNHEHTTKWIFDCYYNNESLGFAYSQIGQENSFVNFYGQRTLDGMRMQLKMLTKSKEVKFQKMGDTGEWFKKKYSQTPATCVVAPDNVDSLDVQSVYYDSKNYTANLFRCEDKIFFRSLFLFDERVKDIYMDKVCTTFDAVYENLPIVHTLFDSENNKKQCGLMIEENACPFVVNKVDDGVLKVEFGAKSVTFYDDCIEILSNEISLYKNENGTTMTVDDKGLAFEHKGTAYRLDVNGANIFEQDDKIIFRSLDKMVLTPKKV